MKETKKNGAAQSKAGKRDYSAFKNMYRKIPQDLRDVIVYYIGDRSKRQFLDTKSVVAAAEKAGYTDIYKTELISLTEFEKLMGKKKFKEILGEYVVKPPGKLALVPNSDPREAVDLETAEDEFTPLD